MVESSGFALHLAMLPFGSWRLCRGPFIQSSFMKQQSIRWHHCSLLALVCRPSCHSGHDCCCCQQAPPGVPAAVPEPTCSACNCSAAGLQTVQGATVCGRAVPEDRAWRATGPCCGLAAAHPCSFRVWQRLKMGLNLNDLQATWLPQSVHVCHTISHWLKTLPSFLSSPQQAASATSWAQVYFLCCRAPSSRARRDWQRALWRSTSLLFCCLSSVQRHTNSSQQVGDPGLHSVQAAVAPAFKGCDFIDDRLCCCHLSKAWPWASAPDESLSTALLLFAGREDMDVRMLGSGRPFMLEIINAKASMPDQAAFDAMQDIHNKVTQALHV